MNTQVVTFVKYGFPHQIRYGNPPIYRSLMGKGRKYKEEEG